MQEFKTIKNDLSNEIVEKKSRFIANIFYVETEEIAKEKIKEIKSKYLVTITSTFTSSFLVIAFKIGAPAVPPGSPSSLDLSFIPDSVKILYA